MEGVGDAVDIVEVADYLDRIVDRLIAPSDRSELLYIRLFHSGRHSGELDRIVEEHAGRLVDICLPVVYFDLIGKTVIIRELPEILSVGLRSVVAVVRP